MDAAEVGGAPHLVGVELVGAAVLVAGADVRVIDALEEGVTGLEAKLAVEVVAVLVSHHGEAVVVQAHYYF